MTPEAQERYLVARGFLYGLGTSNVRHGTRTLDQHLVGTHLLLDAQAEREAVCLAGLFHSIYGTNVFMTCTLKADSQDDRDMVAHTIGHEAEALAYMFCMLQGRPQCFFRSSEIAKPMTLALSWRDLQAIELANLIEQGGFSAVIRYL